MKRVEQLTVHDLQQCAVWEYVGKDKHELCVIPVTELPVTDLSNRLVGTQVGLHNGSLCWAILGNLHLRNLRSTQHFITVSLERSGSWFHLARYHDIEYEKFGPSQLAAFLGLSIEEVFPMVYDISTLAVGVPEAIKGRILAEPTERLSRSEIILLALE